ncbi:MAG: hypothetical protein V1796_03390 [Pseudomonadota bacterium]
MSTRTISEELFEELCAQKCVEYVRIPEGTAKTADYRLTLGGVTLITEVKQLDPSPEEQHLAETWGSRQSPGAIAPSDRVQGLLEEGYPQIKRSAEGKWPAMIVVYNNSGDWNWIDSFTVSKAMFGSFGFVLALQSNQTVALTGHGYLGERKVTKDTCRALSVVGVLKRARAHALALDCYHSPFATFPIDHAALSSVADAQYAHPNPHDKGFIPWQAVAI